MQLVDVLCYIIRKGKESKKRLYAAWQQSNASETTEFITWKKANTHKGLMYFEQSYYKILSSNRVLFSKDFP
jgi:hypothetical protein